MLSTESVESLLSPISEALPSGDDLEYDAAFTALDAPGCVAPPCGHKPTPLSHLAWHANHGTLGRIQLRFLG